MLSFLLIYLLTSLLPDLSIYSFQSRPASFPGRRPPNLALVVLYFITDACLLSTFVTHASCIVAGVGMGVQSRLPVCLSVCALKGKRHQSQ